MRSKEDVGLLHDKFRFNRVTLTHQHTHSRGTLRYRRTKGLEDPWLGFDDPIRTGWTFELDLIHPTLYLLTYF